MLILLLLLVVVCGCFDGSGWQAVTTTAAAAGVAMAVRGVLVPLMLLSCFAAIIISESFVSFICSPSSVIGVVAAVVVVVGVVQNIFFCTTIYIDINRDVCMFFFRIVFNLLPL